MGREKKIVEIEKILQKHGQYSQGLAELGIPGRRDTDARYKMYALDDYLSNDMNVLDIGCNCGFLSCMIARKVRSLLGVDKDGDLLKAATMAAGVLGVKNANFVRLFYDELEGYARRFDLVCALQVHIWTGMKFDRYVDILDPLVRADGLLLFESHDMDNVDSDIECKARIITDRGYTVLHSGDYVEDPGQYLVPVREHKKIPRRFYLFKKLREGTG